MKFNSPYNPKETENKIYKIWMKSGYFNPDKLPERYTLHAKRFSVMMAPPNITGSLHMGHVLENTEVDILVRMKRMRGFKTLWLPGIDHAGISAQNAVEKNLKKQGIRRQDLGREKFVEKVKEWKEKYGTIILDQLKMLGVSSDWSRTRYTLDSEYTKAVLEVFTHYYKRNWIYRGERVINWCPRCETGISDLEIEYKEEKGKLYYIKYPLAPRRIRQAHRGKFIEPQARGDNDYIIVATTRPETMLGDTAVAVNPKDSRYKNLIGKFVVLPISPYGGSPEGRQNRKIPIIGDIAVDMKFGTGAVKVTPAHDITDFEMSLRHNLEKIQIINEKGLVTKEAGTICEGLKTDDCRNKVVEKLVELEFLEKTEDYVHNVAHCERCNTKIEPRLSKQWFLKMSELAKLAIKAIKNKETIITPKKWEKILLNRLKNERDWNISRQLWWGHRLPVWFHEPKCEPKKGHESDIVKCKEFIVSAEEPKCEFCDAKFIQSPNVLDTWFSSALWPFATFGWPKSCNMKHVTCNPRKKTDLAKYYPTDFITSGRDILNIWIAKMIFSGMEFMGKSPFKIAHIHATVLNKEGKRMSKSLGTGVDPLDLIERFGADATRFGIIWQAMGNQDIHWSEEHVVAGKKFANKIWNAARFVLQNAPPSFKFQVFPLRGISRRETSFKFQTEADKKILNGLKKTTTEVGNLIEKYEFGQALHKLYDFFWHEYADVYIEASKKQLRRPEGVGAPTEASEMNKSTQKVLLKVHTDLLKLLHPFMPFITEEIWSAFNKKNLLLIEPWPTG